MIKEGMEIMAITPFSFPEKVKLYIDHVLPSHIIGKKLIVYRYYSKRKLCWVEQLCYEIDMINYKKQAEEKKA